VEQCQKLLETKSSTMSPEEIEQSRVRRVQLQAWIRNGCDPKTEPAPIMKPTAPAPITEPITEPTAQAPITEPTAQAPIMKPTARVSSVAWEVPLTCDRYFQTTSEVLYTTSLEEKLEKSVFSVSQKMFEVVACRNYEFLLRESQDADRDALKQINRICNSHVDEVTRLQGELDAIRTASCDTDDTIISSNKIRALTSENTGLDDRVRALERAKHLLEESIKHPVQIQYQGSGPDPVVSASDTAVWGAKLTLWGSTTVVSTIFFVLLIFVCFFRPHPPMIVMIQ
jgi:hypothetical protein